MESFQHRLLGIKWRSQFSFFLWIQVQVCLLAAQIMGAAAAHSDTTLHLQLSGQWADFLCVCQQLVLTSQPTLCTGKLVGRVRPNRPILQTRPELRPPAGVFVELLQLFSEVSVRAWHNCSQMARMKRKKKKTQHQQLIPFKWTYE